MSRIKVQCKGCLSEKQPNSGQWWHLNGYFGFTGLFCPKCFDMVSHDAYGNPNNPAKYTWMILLGKSDNLMHKG